MCTRAYGAVPRQRLTLQLRNVIAKLPKRSGVHDQVKAAPRWGGDNRVPAFFTEAVDGIQSFVRLAAVAGDDQNLLHLIESIRLRAFRHRSDRCPQASADDAGAAS